MLDFNSEPYSDDYNVDNKFYRVLYRPGFAVQARELTQIQSILQNQIKQQGDHFFKQGAMVIPGQISVDNNYNYVKLQTLYGSTVIETYIQNFVGARIVGSSGIQAEVLAVVNANVGDPTTLYVRYITSGADNVTKVFANNEVITTADTLYTVQAAASSATGVGSAAIIQRGVYYINGFFVLCDAQTLILDKYTNYPSYRIGLTIVESKVTPEEDETLLDNAQNSYNYAAPGAHRYFIDLVLTKLAIDSILDDNFIELSRVENGDVKREVRATEYSVLESTLARRTYDESGNYTVRPFEIDVREHRNNNRGQWLAATAYLIGDVVSNGGYTFVAKNSSSSVSTAPVHTTGSAYDGPGSTGINWEYNQSPIYNRGVYTPAQGGNEAKLAIGLEPGKAYVQGYEIEKISTEFLTVDKAREFVQTDASIVPATMGNYVLVNMVNSLPKFDTFDTVDLYDRVCGSGAKGTAVGTKIGTCRIRGLEWHTGTTDTSVTGIYKLFIFDVKMNSGFDFNRDVKSFYFDAVGVGATKDFTADVQPVATQLIGSASSSTTTITGVGTSFTTDLTVGDYILLDTQLRRVVTITGQQGLTVDVAPSPAVTGVTIKLVTTVILEPENVGLIFPLPYYAIKSVRSVLGVNDTVYTVSERYVNTANGSGTLTLNATSGAFASAAETDNYTFVNDTTGLILTPTTITPSGGTLTVAFGAPYAGVSILAMCTVNKSGGTLTEKTKTLNSVTATFTTQATATAQILNLGKADCLRIVSIKMKSGTFGSPGATYSIDIKDRYTFDNGQRETHYDYGRLILNASFSQPTAPIEVIFESFSHSSGDYFTVNSYPANIDYKDIPYFGSRSLRDVIDFRPRIDDAGATFSGTGASTTLLPKRGIDIRADFTYYLGRKDKIAIDSGGNFFDIKGVSSLNPGDPLDPSLGMVLYKINLEPYTFGTSSYNVGIEKYDNKRYTMRDIGKLENRINNLEYYTSLSLLEQSTQSMAIPDTNGLDRFKNGFIVDNFTGHNIGDVLSADYVCAVDMENGELRPFYTMKNINLLEKNSNTAQRTANNYKLYGDVITLPVLEDVALITQAYASRVEFVNPYAVFTFIGDVNIFPSSDDWFEVDRRPDLIRNEDGNFNTIVALAQSAGVLGTVWNAWQTQWTGTAITGTRAVTVLRAFSRTEVFEGRVSRQDLEMSGRNFDGTSTLIGQLNLNTTATTTVQSRTGTRTSVVSKVDTRIVDDRVLSTAVIPYIRSRNILIKTKGLKPLTRFYPYFDDIDIAAYCTPAAKITYTVTTGTFDSSTNSGGLGAETARRINGDSQVCLNSGDVLTGGTSGAKAVVVSLEYNPTTLVRALYVQNITGTFVNGETISGSISTATGVITSITTTTIGSNLISNINGELNLLFNIPNNNVLHFRTGSREFKLLDVSSASGNFTSKGRATYSAQGVIETRQASVVATRNANIVSEIVNENQTVIQSISQQVPSAWYDPLAQTFLIQQPGGAFLSKVDLFFAAKDSTIPVSIEIREVVNGYPGKRVLPFSRMTINPTQVNLSGVNVTLDGVAYPKYDTATTFNFTSPVYVQDNTEYCLVIMSDSNKYKVWISQMGDVIPGSSRTISEQPYAGVLFKSQNASTWTANQLQDLKFTIYRAKFDISVNGAAQFVNDVVPKVILDIDPFEIVSGTNVVRVWQQNHGMSSGSSVILSDDTTTRQFGVVGAGTITTSTGSSSITGVSTVFNTSIGTTTVGAGAVIFSAAGVFVGIVASVASDTSLTLSANAAVTLAAGSSYKIAQSINGIPVTQLYSTLVISNVELDSYTVTVTNNATVTGYTGNNTVRATQNIQYDCMQPQIQVQTFSDTTTTFSIKTTSGKSVDGAQTPYVIDSTFTNCLANENNYFYSPRVIASEINETTSMSSNKSVTLTVNLNSTNNALSPIIDTHRTSLVAISNKINSPTETNTNVTSLDSLLLFTGATGAYSFAGSTITSTNATVRALLPSIRVGTYLTVASATTGGNNGTFLVTGNTDNGTTGTITVTGITFASEAAAAGTSITKRKLFYDEIAPIGSSTFSKYVSKNISLTNPSSFLRVRYAGNIPSEATVLLFYKISPAGAVNNLNNTNWVLFSPDTPITKVENGDGTYYDIDYSIDNLVPFDALAVKLVMQSTNTSAIPRVKDLRIIACA